MIQIRGYALLVAGSCTLAGCSRKPTIAGTITPSAGSVPAVVSGVTVRLTGFASIVTTSTDSAGKYRVGVDERPWTVTPLLAGYTFTPTSRTVTMAAADVFNVDFAVSPDNVVIGSIPASGQTPAIVLDTIRSSIAGVVNLRDANGTVTSQVQAVIMSDKASLCDAIEAHSDYFRRPPEPYVAIIFFTPLDRVGTFFVGRDAGAGSEIIAAIGTGSLSSLPASSGSYIALTTVDQTTHANADGSFDAMYVDQAAVAHELYGRFKTSGCDGTALTNLLLP